LPRRGSVERREAVSAVLPGPLPALRGEVELTLRLAAKLVWATTNHPDGPSATTDAPLQRRLQAFSCRDQNPARRRSVLSNGRARFCYFVLCPHEVTVRSGRSRISSARSPHILQSPRDHSDLLGEGKGNRWLYHMYGVQVNFFFLFVLVLPSSASLIWDPSKPTGQVDLQFLGN